MMYDIIIAFALGILVGVLARSLAFLMWGL